MKKLAIIGGGAMGGAIARGLVGNNYRPSQILVCDVDGSKRGRLKREISVRTSHRNVDAPRFANTIILAVKPGLIPSVLQEIRSVVSPRQLVISIAAGVPLQKIERVLKNVPVVRVMPNNPCLIGQGMAVVCGGRRARKSHVQEAVRIFEALGRVRVLPERYFDAVTALSGSGPAFVYEFAKGLIQGGVAAGLPREVASELTLQTIRGGALTAQQTKGELDQLVQMVASPGGTTVAGLKVLAQRQFGKTLQDTVVAAARRARELRTAASFMRKEE